MNKELISGAATMLLVSLVALFVLGNKNMERIVKETDQKIALYEKVSPEEARQLVLRELRKEKQYYLHMKLW